MCQTNHLLNARVTTVTLLSDTEINLSKKEKIRLLRLHAQYELFKILQKKINLSGKRVTEQLRNDKSMYRLRKDPEYQNL